MDYFLSHGNASFPLFWGAKMTKSFISIFIAALFSISLLSVGCTKKSSRAGIDPRPESQADADVRNSFNVKNNLQVVGGDKAEIAINRTALGKEFLLQSGLIPQQGTPMGSSLKSRVVFFREKAERLFLMASNQGNSATNDFAQNMILAEFPVIDSNSTSITFDFNAGMANIFVSEDWNADGPSAPYDSDAPFTSIAISTSYIDSAVMDDHNNLVIRQIAQVPQGTDDGDANEPIEVKYYLTPYAPDPKYVPAPTFNSERIGVFGVAPQEGADGATVSYSARFDLSKPVVYAVSSNTPTEYRQAVKDGILYWNKVFGREVVQAVDGPAGVTAPDFNYNIIQWVPDQSVGFAYADAQLDPRSGQVLHSQVYLSDSFGFGGKASLRALLRRLQAGAASAQRSPPARKKTVALKGFSQHELCDYKFSEKTAASMQRLLAQDPTDAAVKKAALDLVRETVAHEVGHTLGMRHNFAGSLATSYALADRDDLIASYIDNQQTPDGVITTSSVMDYELFEEAVFVGDQIARGVAAYAYDKVVMASLYDGKTFDLKDIPLYCTDEDTERFSDCKPFDTGASFVEYSLWDGKMGLDSLANTVLERYLSAKTPVLGESLYPVDQVSPGNVPYYTETLLSDRVALLQQFVAEGDLLSIDRSFPISYSFNHGDNLAARLSYVKNEIARLGGMEAAFPMIPDDFAATKTAEFAALSQKYATGIGDGEQPYTFSADELAVMNKNAATFFKSLQSSLILQDMANLNVPGAPPYYKDPFLNADIVDELVPVFQERMQKYILSTTTEQISELVELPAEDPAAAPTTTQLQLPKFAYSSEIRLEAAKLLRAGRSDAPEWGLAEKASVRDDLIDLMNKALPVPFDKLSPEQLPKDVARWLLDNEQVLGTIDQQ